MRILFAFFSVISGFVILTEALSFRCLACRGAVEALRHLYTKEATQEKIIQIAVFICENFSDNDSFICNGFISQFRDSFLYVIEALLLRPDQLCGSLIKSCGLANTLFDSNWTIPIPEKQKIQQKPLQFNKSQEKVFRVLQLSDLHYDGKYEADSEADCQYPICCQANSVAKNVDQIKQFAGYWGTIGNCDLPYRTIVNMLQHIKETHKIDYIMLTGDYMSHSDWTYTRKDHLDVISKLDTTLNKLFPNIPIYWGIGNHEGVPVNSFAPNFVPKKFLPQWLYKKMYSVGKRWISKEAKPIAIYRGSYSVKITETLKLISVNTGYCETTNLFLYINQTDPNGTLGWLIEELLKSELTGSLVHIMAHVPPGDSECLEGWSRNYYRIVNRFQKTIKAQFFGHVHTDNFILFYENMNDYNSKPSSVLYTAPSVTTYGYLNPAYRIYTIDSSTSDVVDFETHFLNLTAIKDEPKWELLYKAKEEYGISDLSALSWHHLSNQLHTNSTLLEKFIKNYVRRNNFFCDRACRVEILCSQRRGHHNDSVLCGDIQKNKKLFKRVIRQSPDLILSMKFNKNKINLKNVTLEKIAHKDFLNAVKDVVWKKLFSYATGYSN